MVTAQYDCNPDHPDELGFKEGQKLVVTRKLNKDWWVSEQTSSQLSCGVD